MVRRASHVLGWELAFAALVCIGLSLFWVMRYAKK